MTNNLSKYQKFREDLKEMEGKLSDPKIISDHKKFAEISTHHARLKKIVEQIDEYETVAKNLDDNEGIVKANEDAELVEMATSELVELKDREIKLALELKLALLPPDPDDDKNVILEIRAGAGGDEVTAEAIIAQFGCQGCHTILGSGGEIGPSLEDVGARLNAEQIRQSIAEPNAVIAKGFPSGVMPPNLTEQMTDVQLDTLVNFLAGRK